MPKDKPGHSEGEKEREGESLRINRNINLPERSDLARQMILSY